MRKYDLGTIPSSGSLEKYEVNFDEVPPVNHDTQGSLPRQLGLSEVIPAALLKSSNLSSIFSEFDEHIKKCAVENNHVFNLVKLVTKCFAKVRFHHLAVERTVEIKGTDIRRKLNKFILFKNQRI